MRVEKYSSSGKIAPIRRVKQKITSFNYIMKVSISALLILSIALLPKAFTSADPVWQDRYQANWSGGVSDETVIDNDTATTYKEIDRLETTEGISIAEGETAGSLISNIFDMGDKSYFGKAKVTTNDVEGEGAKGEYVLQVRSIPNDKDGYPDIDKAIGWSDACNIATTDEDTNMNIYNSKCVRRPEKYLQYRIIITSDNSDFTIDKINFEYQNDFSQPYRNVTMLGLENTKVKNTPVSTLTWKHEPNIDGIGWVDPTGRSSDSVTGSGLAGLKYCIANTFGDGEWWELCNADEHPENFVGPNGITDTNTAEYLADVYPFANEYGYGILKTNINDPRYEEYLEETKESYSFGVFAVYVAAIDNVGNLEKDDSFIFSLFTNIPSGAPLDLQYTNDSPGVNKFTFTWNHPGSENNPMYAFYDSIGADEETMTITKSIVNIIGGSQDEISYCYKINSSPNPNDDNYDETWLDTCTETPKGSTTLPSSNYGLKQGINTLYIVSKNEAGNIEPIAKMPALDNEGEIIPNTFSDYRNYAEINFVVGTPSPNSPRNVEATDISNRITNDWRVVLSWSAPESNSAKIKRYQIFRSTNESAANDDAWGESIGDTTSLSYTDDSILLNNKDTYYYGVRACDDANNCSDKVDAINIRSGEPGIKLSGRYTEPANLTDGPSANNIGTSKSTIDWQTDRESDSKVYISTKANVDTGKDSDYSAGSDKQVTNHIMDLTNLQPSTKYYYKVTWTDYDNNTGVSSEKSFTTAPAPSFSGVIIDKISVDSASIAFTVSSAKSVSVYYGKTEAFGGIKSVNTSSAKSAYQLNLSDLDDGSKYYVKLNGFDSDGKEYQGSTHYFNTTPRPRIS